MGLQKRQLELPGMTYPSAASPGTGVFEATIDDLQVIVLAARMFHAESPAYAKLPFSSAKVAAWAAMHITDEDMNVWLARGPDGQVVGGLFAQLHETFFGPARIAMENTFYVMPEHRGGDAAAMLVNRFLDWGREKQAVRALITTSSGINQARAMAFLAKFGFEPGATGMMVDIE